MGKPGGEWTLTRRAFLYSSGATLGAATVAFPAADEQFSFLLVETIYEALGGQETLAGVRLTLQNANKVSHVLRLAAADFVAKGTLKLPRFDLTGLNTPFRDPSEPVAETTVLTITVSGVDLFNQQTDLNGQPSTYVFRIACRPSGKKNEPGTWQIGMKTNAWVKPKRNQWLDFPIVGLGSPNSLALIDLMVGNAGFKLELGPGWVSKTLSRVVGQDIAALGDHVAVLAGVPIVAEKSSDGVDTAVPSDGRRSWLWSVRPIDGNSLLTTYGGIIQFRSIRFGWIPVLEPDPAPKTVPVATASVFEIIAGNDPPPLAAFAADKTLISRPNGRVDLPSSRFAVRGERKSDLTVSASDVAATWNTSLMKKTELPSIGEPLVEVTFNGTFFLVLRSAGTTLASVKYTNSPGLRLTPDKGVWQLIADLPAATSDIGELDDLPVGAESAGRVDPGGGSFGRIKSLAAGWLTLQQATAGQTTGGVRLLAQLSIGHVEALAIAALLNELPATLARDPQAPFFSRVAVAKPGIHPILRLRDVPLCVLTEAEVGRVGHIYLESPRDDSKSLPVLDLPMDAAVIQVRRASDMLMLDFRLANMRLRSTKAAGAFILVPDPVEKPDGLSPVDFPNEPALRVDFGPQHMAEQAFLRRDALAGGLPALDLQMLAAGLGGDWPTAVSSAFQTLRYGSRPEKKEARQKLEKLADEAAAIVNAGNAATAEQKRIKEEFEKNDPDIQNRINDFISFAALFKEGVNWLFRRFSPPEDQQIYCGPDDLDPDVASFAWQLRSDDHIVIRRAKLIERLISVDGSYGDAAKLKKDRLSEPGDLNPGILNIIDGATRKISETISFTPAEPDAAVLRVLGDKRQDEDAQRRVSAAKERVAPDYAEFRSRWKRAADAARDTISPDEFPLVEDFASVHWALEGRGQKDPVFTIMRTVVQAMVSLTGEEDEPFPERSRARLSGPTRLAFRWSRRHRSDAEPTGDAPFALSELLDWAERDQLVTLRARGVRSLDREGNLVRISDQAEYLRQQGLEPGRDLSARSWMQRVYALASKAPLPYETAIELPFRLQLSPAQDPTWVFAHDVRIQRSLPDSETGAPIFGRPLWSVALEPADPDPFLRAVWSEDFWPERFQNDRYRLADARDPGDRDAVEHLNDYAGPPAPAPAAPWYRKRLRRQNGEIIDIVPESVSAEEREFRASLDAYDRDQIVLESSVPGILVKRGIDPATGQVIEGGGSYSPPDGYDFIDVATERLLGTAGRPATKISSVALYAPKSLTFRELRLTALGGTLDLHTKFKPPVSAALLDGRNLFPAATLESWRHLTVSGRTIAEEPQYSGYLFPFGHHATLVTLTERSPSQPKGDRGPTSYPVQRVFIRCSEPLKSAWYDQPDGGRGWPVGQMKILTRETADLVDPRSGAPSLEQKDNDRFGVELANGRISLVNGSGLVFWPRTAPFQGAEVAFEFQIDGSGFAHRMPMIFVNKEAANDENTLASLINYYNALQPGIPIPPGGLPSTGYFSSRLDRSSRRVFDQGGARRRYGVPLEEGQTDYETQAWSIGVEGRPGEAHGTKDGELTKARTAALSSRSNYSFSPLLLASDQPPFYPFVQYAEIRLDRLARLIGERQGRECLVAFERGYLKRGFADPAQPSAIPEPMLGILSRAILDVGSRGDRIGAIGRLAGQLFLITQPGPLTRNEPAGGLVDLKDYLLQPPDFGATIRPKEQQTAPAGVLGLADAQKPPSEPKAMTLSRILEVVLGDADVKIFGSFRLLELINQAVMELADAMPAVKEVTDYAGGGVASFIESVRGEVIPALRAVLQAIDKEFNLAAVKVGGLELEARRIYPDIANAMSGLDLSLGEFEKAADVPTAGTKLAAVVTAAKTLLKALDTASRDPISPLKLELRQILLADFQNVEVIEQKIRDLIASLPKLDDVIQVAVQAALARLEAKLKEGATRTSIVAAITRLMPLPDQPIGGEQTFAKIAEEVVAGFYDGIVDKIFKPAPTSPQDLLGKVNAEDILALFGAAVVASTTLKELSGDLKKGLEPLEAEARSYWSQVVMLRGAIDLVLKSASDLAGQIQSAAENDVKERVEALKHLADVELRRLADQAAHVLLGVDGATVASRAQALKVKFEELGNASDSSGKIRLAVELLARIDRLFLRGRFGKVTEQALISAVDNTQIAKVMSPILDGYTAVLDLADVFVEQSGKLDSIEFAGEVAAAEAAISGLAMTTGSSGIAATLRSLMANLPQSPDEVDAAVDKIVAELRDRLDTARVGLMVANTPWLAQVADQMLSLTVATSLGGAVKQFSRNETSEPRRSDLIRWASRFIDAYDPLLEELLRAHTRTALVVFEARLAMNAWQGLSSNPPGSVAVEARSAIEQARKTPSLATYRHVARTFPRSELSVLLDAWPKVAARSLEALEDILPAYLKTAEALDKLQPLPVGAEKDAVIAIKTVEAAIQGFVDREFTIARDRAFAAGQSLVQATGWQPGTVLPPLAKLIKTALDAREGLQNTVAEYPFLQPFADLLLRISQEFSKAPDVVALEQALTAATKAATALLNASSFAQTVMAAKVLRDTLQLTTADRLAALRAALGSSVNQAGRQTRDLAMAQAAASVAVLKNQVDEAADAAEAWLVAEVFASPAVSAPLLTLAQTAESILSTRNALLSTLKRDEYRLAKSIGTVMQFLKLGPSNVEDAKLIPALLFVAVPSPSATGRSPVEDKIVLLSPSQYDKPDDLLADETQLVKTLAGIAESGSPASVTTQLSALRALLNRNSSDLAAVQIVGNFRTVMDQILQANFSSLINFQAIRHQVEDEVRKLLPTRVTTQLDYSVPLGPFPKDAPIFKPIDNGRFTMRSVNTVDFTKPGEPKFNAEARAELAPFEIKLLGDFDAITLVFSAAKLTWSQGSEPHFSIDFVDYRIGAALSFVDQLAGALGQSGGGAFVKLAVGFPGIEAGYRINIPAFTLGGVTFLNVGLAAGARLPFDNRPAQFLASLSSREDPFVIIAGVWGGGGHFQLTSDGRSITGFDASFVFGGGGGVTYGPLTMVGRITVGVFIRKVGQYTEIAGDFFAGGSGRVAIFGISASLTVTTGMTGDGDMFGSAVFRYSFSVGFAKISFSVTVAKKESKGFSPQQQTKQAMLDSRQPYMVADLSGAVSAPSSGKSARLRISTVRQDINYREWRRYFSALRPEGY
ncbi:hypothetical protein HF264_19545 [Rhizobium leguminosarum]|uniref:hypothetical protein n=1 Tax=Rhizobium leguminosarum TaxID=384 RepID=UPI001C90DA62|nr:hypothetical protein [Rhizobium leguminosarum]MBY2941863.1 hypothetical protein [Rhizobium leguminosarum]